MPLPTYSVGAQQSDSIFFLSNRNAAAPNSSRRVTITYAATGFGGNRGAIRENMGNQLFGKGIRVWEPAFRLDYTKGNNGAYKYVVFAVLRIATG